MSESLKKAHEICEISNAGSLKAHLVELIVDARRIQRAAEEAKDYRAAFGGIRESTRLLELAARLSGQLNEKPETKVLIAASQRTWQPQTSRRKVNATMAFRLTDWQLTQREINERRFRQLRGMLAKMSPEARAEFSKCTAALRRRTE